MLLSKVWNFVQKKVAAMLTALRGVLMHSLVRMLRTAVHAQLYSLHGDAFDLHVHVRWQLNGTWWFW
jgi:hypothetical protein